MLEARLLQGGLLKRVFEAIKEMVQDVNLECNQDSIQLQAMDSSHVSLVSLDLKAAAFESFRCDRNRSLGLNMAHVNKVFRLCGSEDAVLIRHEDDSDCVTFVFDSNSNDSRFSTFDLKLLQVDQEHLGVPESESTATVRMPSRHFQKIVNDLAVVADSLVIKVTSKAVTFSTKGDIGSGSVRLNTTSGSEDDSVTVECSESEVGLTFAIRYLMHFTKATPLSSVVELRLTDSQPLEVTFALNGQEDFGHLKFYLAPKMDDNDTANDSSMGTGDANDD